MNVIDYGDKGEVQKLLNRSAMGLEDASVAVKPILNDVRDGGDYALSTYTKKFDEFELNLDNIRISSKEIDAAYSRADKGLIKALTHAKSNIEKFHREQLRQIKREWKTEVERGVSISEKTIPMDSVGCYVPGGRAPYPSTVLMTVIPARIAGVKRIAVCSPPKISDDILAACKIAGVDEVYRVGGAQSIAAMAYGTETIKPVSKIIGPGNVYVMAAKMRVYGKVDIDSPAGPSEILIIADKSANPEFIQADLLAQAEHDPDAQAVVVTDSKELAKKIDGTVVLTKTISECIEFANDYAPEHLEIMCRNPEKVSQKIRNAGAIFLGDYSPVAAGDYCSGGNHVLPTAGTAKFSSRLGVDDFLKKVCVQSLSKEGLGKLRNSIERLSDAEGFKAHRDSVRARFKP
ncbi:MAG: histidinol dehydrogenase [Candidatus Altiarchaeota archaeon]|nr:histidinol dehydrogenase [Candidatus Altiarchaeota archaeon]MBU4341096.1 histidinol dehydrogenase [Candidatus Altiarchaeota archaeon]